MSGVGVYGYQPSEGAKSESSPPGKDFLAQVCAQWESGVSPFAKMGIRTVILRTGVVMDKSDGALAKLSQPIKLGFGSSLGSSFGSSFGVSSITTSDSFK